MGSLGQPTPVTEERDSSRLIIGIAVFIVIAGALAVAFLLREPPKTAKTASPYIANLKLSDFKMSAAENFIGHTVSYIDGDVTNPATKPSRMPWLRSRSKTKWARLRSGSGNAAAGAPDKWAVPGAGGP